MGGLQQICTICKCLHKQHRFIEFQQNVFKRSEQFVLRQQMHAYNMGGGGGRGVKFVYVLKPKTTRLYHTWFMSVKKAKYILLCSVLPLI